MVRSIHRLSAKLVWVCFAGARSVTLTKPPVSLAPELASLLRPETDIKVKHGVIGLLKHLAYNPPARSSLSEAGIIKRLVNSNVFQPTSDIAEMVQINAIGVIKHLCNGNGESAKEVIINRIAWRKNWVRSQLAKNCNDLALSADGQDAASTGLHQILSLVKRSESTAVKSEGTRVFVNVIRTLWHEDTPDGEQRKAAMGIVSTGPIALTLAQLVGRSKRYPILINEGIVALTLLSLHSGA
jgi:hypothetical protein